MARRDCGECRKCDDVRCEWIKGRGLEDDRPDKVMVLVDRLYQGKPVVGCIVAHGLIEGAEYTQDGQSAICNISRMAQLPVFVVDSDGNLSYAAGRGEM